jgi:hypothetical protein
MATLVGIFIEYLFIRFHDFKSISTDVQLLEADVYIISIMTGFTLPCLTPASHFLFLWRRTIYYCSLKCFVLFLLLLLSVFFGKNCLRK